MSITKEEPGLLAVVRDANENRRLRAIDWFFTRYCSDRPGLWPIHENYREQLRALKKTNFDPFRRGPRIVVEGLGETTVGQLNFFRWAVDSGAYGQFERHEADVIAHMSGEFEIMI